MSDLTAKFISAYERLDAVEGGYVDHPDDPGGATNYGITQRSWSDYRTGLGRQSFPVKNLTRPDAMQFYFATYWNALGLERLSAPVAFEVLDTAVNAGIRTGVLCAQRAYNFLRPADWTALKEDGVMGPATRSALNHMTMQYEKQLINAMNGEQYLHYRGLVLNNSKFRSFARGWAKRIA